MKSDKPDSEAIRDLAKSLEELKRRRDENVLSAYKPYPKQRKFHELGATCRERLLCAGNQLGKTFAGGCEVAMHLTGNYPEWWKGHRFSGPIRCWAAGVTSEGARDNPQRLLLGSLGRQGTGTIPKETILEVRPGRKLADAVDTILVRHKSGYPSQCSFNSYEKGRKKWQGETLDLVWMDEEAPLEIYSEALARISAKKGIIFTTFTPLLGMSEVVRRFFSDKSKDRGLVQMSIEDAKHIPKEERQRIIEGYPEHEREARIRGIPMLGSGRIYPVTDSVVMEEAFEIPGHWARIIGLDLGYHNFAAVWLAWDRESDKVYVTDCYVSKEQTPIMHAASIKMRSDWIPCAWPHDALSHEKGSGKTLANQYKAQGLRMLDDRAAYPDGSSSVEAGIIDILDRMRTDRLKVFDHLNDWFDEFRLYHRKDGRIVKKFDHLMDATRYGIMMLRKARTGPQRRGPRIQMAFDTDYDVFGVDERI